MRLKGLKLDDKGRKACRSGSPESARAGSLTSAASSRPARAHAAPQSAFQKTAIFY